MPLGFELPSVDDLLGEIDLPGIELGEGLRGPKEAKVL